MASSSCPVCDRPGLAPFLDVGSVPALCGALWEGRDQAMAAPVGELRLAFCDTCAMITNLAFDPEALDYTTSYENSLHFSPSFQRYAEDLADRLIATYDLHGRDIIEIGSGKGEFLRLLCDRGGNRGVGFDSTYGGESDSNDGPGQIRFVRDYYSESYSGEPADFICSRHVLEHLGEPAAFLAGLRRAVGDRATNLYFEVPDATYTLGPAGLWDIIYPHCSYFSAPSLRRLFSDAGFFVKEVGRSFGEQYLYLEAAGSITTAPVPPPPPVAEEIDVVRRLVESFAQRYRTHVERWSENLGRFGSEGSGVVLWGAGAKGVTFLNAVENGHYVDAVIDLNPRKHGRYVPGTGQEVLSPGELRSQRPGTVLITNPLYEAEIRAHLATMDVNAEVLCV